LTPKTSTETITEYIPKKGDCEDLINDWRAIK